MTQEQWNQIKHFNPNEKWGNPEKMDFRLIWILDKLREEIGAPFIVHCGYETNGHESNSFHYSGQAVDFHVNGIGLYTAWFELIKIWKLGGLGIYPHWNNPGFHLDLGSHRQWYRDKDGNYSNLVNGEFEE